MHRGVKHVRRTRVEWSVSAVMDIRDGRWGPAVDGVILPGKPLELLRDGNFNRDVQLVRSPPCVGA